MNMQYTGCLVDEYTFDESYTIARLLKANESMDDASATFTATIHREYSFVTIFLSFIFFFNFHPYTVMSTRTVIRLVHFPCYLTMILL